MNFEDTAPSEISQSQRTGIAWFHSSEVSKRAKHIESGPGLGRGRDGALIYNKLKVLVMQDN